MSQPFQIKNLLPAAISSQVPARQESRQPATTEERQLANALSESRICNGTEKELKQALQYIFVLVGLKSQNFPVAEEKLLLHEFIFENYGEHTPAELKLAFKLAITQKLNLKPDKVICYENFSVAYFCLIMEAYRDWARVRVKQLPAPEEKPREFTIKEKLQLDLDYAYCLLKRTNRLPPL